MVENSRVEGNTEVLIREQLRANLPSTRLQKSDELQMIEEPVVHNPPAEEPPTSRAKERVTESLEPHRTGGGENENENEDRCLETGGSPLEEDSEGGESEESEEDDRYTDVTTDDHGEEGEDIQQQSDIDWDTEQEEEYCAGLGKELKKLTRGVLLKKATSRKQRDEINQMSALLRDQESTMFSEEEREEDLQNLQEKQAPAGHFMHIIQHPENKAHHKQETSKYKKRTRRTQHEETHQHMEDGEGMSEEGEENGQCTPEELSEDEDENTQNQQTIPQENSRNMFEWAETLRANNQIPEVHSSAQTRTTVEQENRKGGNEDETSCTGQQKNRV